MTLVDDGINAHASCSRDRGHARGDVRRIKGEGVQDHFPVPEGFAGMALGTRHWAYGPWIKRKSGTKRETEREREREYPHETVEEAKVIEGLLADD